MKKFDWLLGLSLVLTAVVGVYGLTGEFNGPARVVGDVELADVLGGTTRQACPSFGDFANTKVCSVGCSQPTLFQGTNVGSVQRFKSKKVTNCALVPPNTLMCGQFVSFSGCNF